MLIIHYITDLGDCVSECEFCEFRGCKRHKETPLPRIKQQQVLTQQGELNILSCHIVMEMVQEWFPELEMEDQMLMTDDEIRNLNNTMDSISVDSFSSENMKLIDQFVHTDQQHENKPPHYQEKSSNNINQSSQTLEPLIATIRPSPNTFTISFSNITPKTEILQFPDSVPTTAANNIQARDHVLAERNRREKLNQHFISISALLPKHKKMNKASVLDHAVNYIKELQNRVKELEALQSNKRKDIQQCGLSIKRFRNEYSSWDETDSIECTDPCKSSPKIEVQISETSVLVTIRCQKNISSLVNTLTQMQNLGLSIISSSAMPFANTTMIITIVAQIEDDFSMTTKEFERNLQLAI